MTGRNDDWFAKIAAAQPLLTREQEGALGFQIEAGVLAQERLNTRPDLPASDADALRLLVGQGDKARERFILANVKLARHWASRRWHTGSVGTLTLDDLTSEGMRAIVHAVEMFDHTLGNKFSTYATFWIRQNIARAVAKSLRLTFTVNDMRRVQDYLLWRDQFTATHFITPTLVEVREGMGLTTRAAMDVITMVKHTGRMSSLDAPLTGEGDFRLADTIVSTDPGPEQAAMRGVDHDLLVAALACLSARERAVVVARTGWDGDEPQSAAEAAATFGVSTTRVRAVTHSAMLKLRDALTHPGANIASMNATGSVRLPSATITCTIDLTGARAA